MTVATFAEPRAKRYTVKIGDKVIGRAELKRLPVGMIKIDPSYQRDVSQPWVHSHLPFQEQQAGAIVVSSRAGGPYCIDGGHRLALAKASNVDTINAFVIDGLSKQEEAALFTRYQRERRNLTAHALYRADVVAGDPETLAMVNVLNRAGFKFDKNTGEYSISAIDSVRYIYRQGGATLLSEVLELVKSEMWIGLDKALSGPVLKGIALFLQSSASAAPFRRDRLSRVMRDNGPTKLLLVSQEIAMKRRAASTSAANVAEALLQLYNGKLPAEQQLPTLTIGSRKRPNAKAERTSE